MSENAPASAVTIPLKELKNKFPIEVGGKIDQFFTFRDWTFKEEEYIAKAKTKFDTIGRFISDVLAMMLVSVGDEDFSKKDKAEKILFMNQQPMGNVLYMYIYLRYDQLGEELRLTFKCPFCNADITNFVADIGDLDIDCKFGKFEEVVNYKLKKPITLDVGEQLVETLKVGIAKWDIMEKNDGSSNDEATMKRYSYKNSIVGAEGITGFVNLDEITGKLQKRDIEHLGIAISKHNGGPSVQAEVECKKCNNTFWKQIDWSYDHFFGIGSLPQA